MIFLRNERNSAGGNAEASQSGISTDRHLLWPRESGQRAGWVEPFVKPIRSKTAIDGYRFARVADVRVEHRDHSGTEYWSRPKPAPASVHQPHQPTVAGIEMLRSQDWTRFVDGRIERAIAARDEYWRDVLGGLVAEVRKQLRAEILTEVGLLRADIEIAKKAADARELDHGAIIDLPKLLGRKRSA
jgi:hypothetical protein